MDQNNPINFNQFDWANFCVGNTAQRLFHESNEGMLTVRKQDVIVHRSALDVETLTNAAILLTNLVRAGMTVAEIENLRDVLVHYRDGMQALEDKQTL